MVRILKAQIKNIDKFLDIYVVNVRQGEIREDLIKGSIFKKKKRICKLCLPLGK
jgi:hypothetical protein